MSEPIDSISARPTEGQTQTHLVLRGGAEGEMAIAARDQALVAIRAAALVAVRERAEHEAAEAKRKAQRAREAYELDASAAHARLDEAKELSRLAAHFAEEDRVRCKICKRPLAERKKAPASSDEPPVLGRVCSEKCAAKLEAQAAAPAAAMTRIDTAVEAARVRATFAEAQAVDAEATVALVRLDRAAIRDNAEAKWCAYLVAGEARREAEVVFERAAEVATAAGIKAAGAQDSSAAIEALTPLLVAEVEAECALGSAIDAWVAAEAASRLADAVWHGLLEREVEENEAEVQKAGRRWPARCCSHCELPLADPSARFCSAACKRATASKEHENLEWALRCAHCRRCFVVPPDMVVAWPDQLPVCGPLCLAALPLDIDEWKNFVWPAIEYTGPPPATAGARWALGSKRAAGSRKRRAASETVARAAPSPPPDSERRALHDPVERARPAALRRLPAAVPRTVTFPDDLPTEDGRVQRDPASRARQAILGRLAQQREPVGAPALLARIGVHVGIASRVLAGLVEAGVVVRSGRGSRGQPFTYKVEA
jgi:hypothetical protein